MVGKLEKVQKQVYEARLNAVTDKANRDVDAFQARLDKVSRTIAEATAKVRADTRELNTAEAEMNKWGRRIENAKAGVLMDRLSMAEWNKAKVEYDRWGKRVEKARADIDADTGGLKKANAELTAFGLRRVTAKADIDTRGAAGAMSGLISTVLSAVGLLSGPLATAIVAATVLLAGFAAATITVAAGLGALGVVAIQSLIPLVSNLKEVYTAQQAVNNAVTEQDKFDAMLKMNTLMALLPPEMRQVVLGAVDLGQSLQRIGNYVMPDLLRGMLGFIDAGKANLPFIAQLAGGAATGFSIMGERAREAAVKASASPEWQVVIGRLRDQLPYLITSLGTQFGNLGAGLIKMAAGFSGPMQLAVDWVTRLTQRFSDWAQNRGPAEMQKFMDWMRANGPQLGQTARDVAHSVGEIVIALAKVPTSSAMLTVIDSLAKVLAEIVKTPVGAWALSLALMSGGLVRLGTFAAGAVGPILNVGRAIAALVFGSGLAAGAGGMERLGGALLLIKGRGAEAAAGANAAGGSIATLGRSALTAAPYLAGAAIAIAAITVATKEQASEGNKAAEAQGRWVKTAPIGTYNELTASIARGNKGLADNKVAWYEEALAATASGTAVARDIAGKKELTKEINASLPAWKNQKEAIDLTAQKLGVSKDQAMQMLGSLNLDWKNTNAQQAWGRLDESLKAAASQAGITQAALREAAQDSGKAVGDIAKDIQKAVEATAQAFQKDTDVVQEFGQKVGVTGDEIRKFYADNIKGAQDFGTNIQKALQQGYDPALISRILSEGPKQAGPLLDSLVKNGNETFVKMVNDGERAMTEAGRKAVEIQRLTALAVARGNNQMTNDLAIATKLDMQIMAQGGIASTEELARGLGIPAKEVERILGEFGIDFHHTADDAKDALGRGGDDAARLLAGNLEKGKPLTQAQLDEYQRKFNFTADEAARAGLRGGFEWQSKQLLQMVLGRPPTEAELARYRDNWDQTAGAALRAGDKGGFDWQSRQLLQMTLGRPPTEEELTRYKNDFDVNSKAIGQAGWDAGNWFPDGLNTNMQGKKPQVVGTLGEYFEALKRGLNPLLTAVGSPPIQAQYVNGEYVSHATGGIIVDRLTRIAPGATAGEEGSQYPEAVIATNPAYRQRNIGLWQWAGEQLGMFAGGGTTGCGAKGKSCGGSCGGGCQFAQGGILQYAQGGMCSGAADLYNWIRGQGINASISSGFRPGGTSLHASGQAIDLVGDFGAIVGALNRTASSLAEGIHNPAGGGGMLSIKNGRVVSPDFWGGATWAQHANHVHAAVMDCGHFMPGVGGMAAPCPPGAFCSGADVPKPPDFAKWQVQAMINAGNLSEGWDYNRGADKQYQEAVKYADAQKAARDAAASSSGVFPAGAGGGNRAANIEIARRLIHNYGWGDDQMGPLITLWDHESGWNQFAKNPSSAAHGIPQAMTNMGAAAEAGNVEAQENWGLNYIKGRYGSPAGAWAFWQAHNWYREGAVRGPTLAGLAASLGGGLSAPASFASAMGSAPIKVAGLAQGGRTTDVGGITINNPTPGSSEDSLTRTVQKLSFQGYI